MRLWLSFLARVLALLAIGLPLQAASSGSRDSGKVDRTRSPEVRNGTRSDASASEPGRDREAAKTDYILQPEDVIRVQVLREEEINKLGEVQVSQEHTVVLPLIGTVDLRGKTVRQAQSLIRDLYDRDYFVNPHVNVSVVKYVERYVKVFGMVNKPGTVPFPPESGLTLSEAISKAEGFSRLADQKRVMLTRTLLDGTTKNETINAADLLKGGPGDVSLQPGDIINVPERFL